MAVVERKGAGCYSKCSPADRADPTSDCAVTCFFETVIGKSQSFPSASGPGMAAHELTGPWEAAFSEDDPAVGGCPPL